MNLDNYLKIFQKNIKKILFIFICIYILYFLNNQNNFYKYSEYFNNNKISVNLPKYAFGNVLSTYFYYLTKAYHENKNLYINNYNDNYFKELHKLLPREVIINNHNNPYNNKNNNLNGIKPESIWLNIHLLSDTIPILRDNILFKKNKKYSKDCIIHYRCSDVPFVKHNSYHLLRFKWYKNAIKECLKKTSIDKIYILNCNNHLSDKKKKNECIKWCNLLINYINNDFNINAYQICNSLEKDILFMLNSKCLISSGSSLSFCLGMLSNNFFVYPSMSTENKDLGCLDKQLRINSVCLKKKFIKHKEVKDYYNLDTSLLYTL